MSANITRLDGPYPFKFQAWCEDCQDGYNGSRVTVEDWRDLHNQRKHPEAAA